MSNLDLVEVFKTFLKATSNVKDDYFNKENIPYDLLYDYVHKIRIRSYQIQKLMDKFCPDGSTTEEYISDEMAD